jgi:hypothetical protein
MRTLYIAVNRNRIATNRKHGLDEPVLRICEGLHGRPSYANEFEAVGRVRVVYRPDCPLPCGARAWIEIERR